MITIQGSGDLKALYREDQLFSKFKCENFIKIKNKPPEPIVLVILKSVCFLIHALLPRDLKALGLKSAR
jgi:hypothetical protein